MNHPYKVSEAAAARLLLMAARISGKVVLMVADVVEGRRDPDSCSWNEYGEAAVALAAALGQALRRSQRARQAARARSAAAAPSVEKAAAPLVDVPSEMRRTSRGMEKFYRWPDRSWRRTPPTVDDLLRLTPRRRRKRS